MLNADDVSGLFELDSKTEHKRKLTNPESGITHWVIGWTCLCGAKADIDLRETNLRHFICERCHKLAAKTTTLARTQDSAGTQD